MNVLNELPSILKWENVKNIKDKDQILLLYSTAVRGYDFFVRFLFPLAPDLLAELEPFKRALEKHELSFESLTLLKKSIDDEENAFYNGYLSGLSGNEREVFIRMWNEMHDPSKIVPEPKENNKEYEMYCLISIYSNFKTKINTALEIATKTKKTKIQYKNPLTSLSKESVYDIPEERRFVSESGHAFDISELQAIFRQTNFLSNPENNEPFSNGDLKNLFIKFPDFFNELMQKILLNNPLLVVLKPRVLDKIAEFPSLVGLRHVEDQTPISEEERAEALLSFKMFYNGLSKSEKDALNLSPTIQQRMVQTTHLHALDGLFELPVDACLGGTSGICRLIDRLVGFQSNLRNIIREDPDLLKKYHEAKLKQYMQGNPTVQAAIMQEFLEDKIFQEALCKMLQKQSTTEILYDIALSNPYAAIMVNDLHPIPSTGMGIQILTKLKNDAMIDRGVALAILQGNNSGLLVENLIAISGKEIMAEILARHVSNEIFRIRVEEVLEVNPSLRANLQGIWTKIKAEAATAQTGTKATFPHIQQGLQSRAKARPMVPPPPKDKGPTPPQP